MFLVELKVERIIIRWVHLFHFDNFVFVCSPTPSPHHVVFNGQFGSFRCYWHVLAQHIWRMRCGRNDQHFSSQPHHSRPSPQRSCGIPHCLSRTFWLPTLGERLLKNEHSFPSFFSPYALVDSDFKIFSRSQFVIHEILLFMLCCYSFCD